MVLNYFYLKKTLVKVSIVKVDGPSQRVIDILTLTKLGRSHTFFDVLISNISSKDDSIKLTSYYKSDNNNIHFITKQPRRKLNTIFLEKELKEKLTHILDNFVSKKDFYHTHGIPYQMGILLYGPPGTGKTALIKAIADILNMSITIAETVIDFTEACSTVKNSIIVAEEIDTFGVSKRSDSSDSSKVLEENIERENQKLMYMYGDDYAKYTLGKLLTSIDGLINNDGRIIIMTTNKPITLDTALTRPGRIDLQLKIGFMTTDTFCEMIMSFFPNYIVPTDFKITDSISASEVQNEILLGTIPEKIIQKFSYHKR